MEELTYKLKKLASEIKEQIDYNLSQGLIKPDYLVYLKQKIDKFRYTEQGLTDLAAHDEHIIKKSYFRACLKVQESIEKSAIYSGVFESLQKIVKDEKKGRKYVYCFVHRLILKYLEEPNFKDTDLEKFVAIFLKNIRGESVKYGAKIELDGIVIIPQKIEFKVGDIDITLRQPKIEDLEKESLMGVYRKPYLSSPSAILQIEFFGREANEIQTKVNQAITILRLFKVGSVRYLSYHTWSESVIDMGASSVVTAMGPSVALEKSQLFDGDKEKLKKFWETMIKVLPPNFYNLGKTGLDYITIAYTRYCDALLNNGALERRIANVVMGFESLFLRGEELQELSYRLCMRIARILALMGSNPYDVRKIIKDSYHIRSLFVHGGCLNNEKKRKLEDRYGNARHFLLSLLDYLRICIIIAIFLNKYKKEEFIGIIDDSLIDIEKQDLLNNLLRPVKEYI